MTQNPGPKKVNFDEYANDYEKLLQDQLQFFSRDRGFFSRYKAGLLSQLAPVPERILDFGAGIGLMIPALRESFPNATLSATDISTASLAHLSRKFPEVTVLADHELQDFRFDLILVATVLHHIEPALRRGVMARLSRLLSPGGCLCVFEHNPLNPITQRMVSTCPFDEDAILLPMRETVDLLVNASELSLEKRGFTLFVPPALSALRPIEKYIDWLPLGGQYFVVGRCIG